MGEEGGEGRREDHMKREEMAKGNKVTWKRRVKGEGDMGEGEEEKWERERGGDERTEERLEC